MRKMLASIVIALALLANPAAQSGTRVVNVGAAKITSGSGSPEGVVTGNVGDLYLRTNGGTATTLYIKESGTGNTGWAAAGAGGGGGGTGGTGAMVLLEQHTASSSASLDFTGCISSAYDEYQIEFVGLAPATDNAALWMRVSTNGGSSYDSGNNYSNANYSFHESAAAATGGGASQSKIIINGGYTSTANYVLNGSIKFYTPGAATFKSVIGNSMARYSSGDAHRIQFLVHGQYDSTTAVNAFQFLNSSGNIASGTIRCYALSK